MESGLNERKLKILQAVVDDYITTGIPVGSRTISRKYLDLSSATIRNEMMDLEELGYLAQPYTSAGRIPSERAYRLYVEKLMKVSELTVDEIRRLESHVDGRTRDMRQLLADAARAISDATTYTAFVLPPNPRDIVIQNLQLVPIATGLALVVLVTDAGIFKDTYVRIAPEFTQEDLYKISVLLQNSLIGTSLSEVERKLAGEMQSSIEGQREVLQSLMISINEQLEGSLAEGLVLGGSTNILQHPEYASVEKARSFIEAVESRDTLIPVLNRARGMEFTVTIGSENAHEAIRDCSIVTVSYNVDDKAAGSIGVIGPTRMNYSHVTSVLNYMQSIITELVEGRVDRLRGGERSIPERGTEDEIPQQE